MKGVLFTLEVPLIVFTSSPQGSHQEPCPGQRSPPPPPRVPFFIVRLSVEKQTSASWHQDRVIYHQTPILFKLRAYLDLGEIWLEPFLFFFLIVHFIFLVFLFFLGKLCKHKNSLAGGPAIIIIFSLCLSKLI